MGIPLSYYLSDLGYGLGKVYRGCPYHQRFGKRGEAHITVTAVVSFPLESGSEGLELMYSWPKSVETEGPLQYLFRVGFALFEGRD